MNIVVGTSMAGLTAAYLLAKKGESVVVIDRVPRALAGGSWRGHDYAGGFHFEAGMRWYTDCGLPEIDGFWRGLLPADEVHEIPREIAGCWWNGRLQTNSPYPDVRGGQQFYNRPVMEKIWGVPLEDLAPGADRLVKIDRVVAYDEHKTALAYESDPRTREHFAWPDQRTLPVPYQSGRRSFYPKRGMAALVDAAIAKLEAMGVRFVFAGASIDGFTAHQVLYAAGVKQASAMYGIAWPSDMTPPRKLTVINALIPPGINDHDLHYAFDYEPDSPVFRVTWYRAFTGDPSDGRVSYELLHPSDLSDFGFDRFTSHGHLLDNYTLGAALPVPTHRNEALLAQVRDQLTQVPNLTLIGPGATAGLFYQPEILRHVAEVCG